MAVSYSTFLDRFPEFTPHPAGIVNGAISEATADASADVFGDQTDRAVKGLEATQYGQEFKRMLETVAGSFTIGFVV